MSEDESSGDNKNANDQTLSNVLKQHMLILLSVGLKENCGSFKKNTKSVHEMVRDRQ